MFYQFLCLINIKRAPLHFPSKKLKTAKSGTKILRQATARIKALKWLRATLNLKEPLGNI